MQIRMYKYILVIAGVIIPGSNSFSQSTEAEKGDIEYKGEISMPLKGEWKLFWNKFCSEDQ